MYNVNINTKEIFVNMKRIAILLGILLFAQSAFAGGTMLYYGGGFEEVVQQQTTPVDPNSTLYTADGIYNGTGTRTVSYETKRRIGRQKNDPNVYWNFGAVNFGSGFTSTGSSVKQY